MIQINQNQKIEFLILAGLVKKTDYNTKITEIEGKIPDVSSLATKTALTIVENKKCLFFKKKFFLKKQIIKLKLQKLKINLTIIIMINILLLLSLILQPPMFLMQD